MDRNIADTFAFSEACDPIDLEILIEREIDWVPVFSFQLRC